MRRPCGVKLIRILALTSMLLAGCASAPHQDVGPMLPKGPLHGRLDAGVYHDMRGWFSVSTPIPPSDPAYPYLGVTEQYETNISFVAFLPTLSPGEFYRAYMEDFYGSNHQVTDLRQIADSAMKLFGKDVVQARSEPMHLVEERPWHVGSSDGLLRLYTERTPTTAMMANLGMAEDYTAYILMYIGADHGKVAMLWLEWPEGCKPCTPLEKGPSTTSQDPIDKALADDARAGRFMASFHFGND